MPQCGVTSAKISATYGQTAGNHNVACGVEAATSMRVPRTWQEAARGTHPPNCRGCNLIKGELQRRKIFEVRKNHLKSSQRGNGFKALSVN
jgi:hypothetical protein